MMATATQDKGVDTTSNEVLETTDYKIFKTIEGNRKVDETHVKRLVHSLEEHGNLTNHFPITVNERMEVIDGQHRLEAIKQLKWPIGYRIQEGLTIATVRTININQKNWTWRDYADSFAKQGNINYIRFLQLADKHNEGFHVLIRYSGAARRKQTMDNSFTNGEMVFSQEDYERADKLLAQLAQARSITGKTGTLFAHALYRLMLSPSYDHERMIHKMRIFGDEGIKAFANINDYMRQLEDIYNYKAKDVVRLF